MAMEGQHELVEHLKREQLARSARVVDALERTDRGHFTGGIAGTYGDHPLGIGLSQTISAPHMHAMCLELLAPHIPPADGPVAPRVLDVGCGSGYLTAALARMVGPAGLVVGIDRFQALVDMSARNIERSFGRPLEDIPNVRLYQADGWLGLAEHAPYHAIHVGAAASAVPRPLLDQLAVGGRLVIPVGDWDQSLMLFDKKSDSEITKKIVCDVRYVPLVEGLPSDQ